MDYEEGVAYMIGCCERLREEGVTRQSLRMGRLVIEYPGRKRPGDYRMTWAGRVLNHDEIVHHLHDHTTPENAREMIAALDDLYREGLKGTHPFFIEELKELLFWITLQEEINYPQQERYAGRKLSYQRFYEAVLAKLGHLDIDEVVERTNNDYGPRPPLLAIDGIEHPSFYR